jgi:hypothetical protein
MKYCKFYKSSKFEAHDYHRADFCNVSDFLPAATNSRIFTTGRVWK